jgi:DNA-binding transcriptional LysR family regulator
MDRLDAMRIFVAVAKLGSFAEAARQLRLSPSVATRSVAQLEDQLGLTLLTRTTRSLRLTDRGDIFLESCQQILDDMNGAERRVRGESAEPRGELKVAAPILFGRVHVLPIVNCLLSKHRGLSIRLMLSDRNVHLVDEGIDVAMRVGDLADSSLIAVKLGEVSRVLVASPAYLKNRGVPKSPAELADHDIIAFENIDVTNEWRFKQNETIRVAPRLAVNSADAAIAAAEVGTGITRTLSYQIRASVLAGRLVPILQKFAPPVSPVNAIYPARRIPSANVAEFIKTARTHFMATPLVPVQNWREHHDKSGQKHHGGRDRQS